MQRDRRLPDNLAASRVLRRRDLQRATAELRRRNRIGREQRARRLEERRDCQLIAWLGAGGKLRRDFHREGAALEQGAGRLAVEGAPRRRWNARAHSPTRDVVPEPQLFVALHKQIGTEQLVDRAKKRRRGPAERACELAERERLPQ